MTFPVLGDTLLDVIKRFDYRGAPLAFVKRMSRDVLLALDYLHARKKIIHTDLKPENVLLTKRTRLLGGEARRGERRRAGG
jgi:serine/threonine-protein kinase SRPK3